MSEKKIDACSCCGTKAAYDDVHEAYFCPRCVAWLDPECREIAEAALRVVTGDLAAGRAGLPPDPKAEPMLSVLADDVLDRRKLTHRPAACDRYRWKKHLAPHFAHVRPGEVDVARFRAFIEVKLAEGVNPATIRIFVSLLSAVFTDAVEQGQTPVNPVRSLPRSVRRLSQADARPAHDPVHREAGGRAPHLPRPAVALNIAYAIGALAGLRMGEVFALRWGHVDLPKRRIHVRESVAGPLKDKDSRGVPILDALLPVLAEWKLRSGGEGRVIPPLRCDGRKVDKATRASSSARRWTVSGSPAPASAGTRPPATPSRPSGCWRTAPSRS